MDKQICPQLGKPHNDIQCEECLKGLKCEDCGDFSTSTCDDCGHTKPASPCGDCGKELALHCPDHGHLNKANVRFQCQDCGWKIATCPDCVAKHGGVHTASFKKRFLSDHPKQHVPNSHCAACGSTKPLISVKA